MEIFSNQRDMKNFIKNQRMRKMRRGTERFANVFDENAFTVSHLDFLIAIVVCSIRKIMEVICHMIGGTRIGVLVLVIVAVLGSG